ncbi:hypothetical protein AGDE_13655 [Angomonas deanei]|nr:hypothetical protein AGDE_13655 [Angomonas deanei]|eukprot:EPY21938.1 hypothetical protein AGDE_13655 [Angomonas deanei]
MLSLLNDVLHASVWVSYIARGGAMAHLLTSSTLLFRTQHVEELRLLTPTLVQEWMTVALVSGFRLSLGVDLLLGDIPDPQEVKTESTTASAIRCRTVPTFSGSLPPLCHLW